MMNVLLTRVKNTRFATPNLVLQSIAYDMSPKAFYWSCETGIHQLVLAGVPGTSGTPYSFGHGDRRKAVELESFYIGTTPVTQALWEKIMGANGSLNADPRCPVENVSWDDLTSPGGFLDRINASEILTSMLVDERNLRFRLPTEAEWEYAARGGPSWRDDFEFSGSNDPDTVAWYGWRWGEADQAYVDRLGWPAGWRAANLARKQFALHTRTHPVATKAPNQLMLYDMSGNVWEWCQDDCTDDVEALPSNGHAYVGAGSDRRLRGGCHHNWDLHCRVWWRYGIQSDSHDGCIGFRLVLAPQTGGTNERPRGRGTQYP